ncbi:competence/damage-inducible protein A [Vagococcus carniphilus]|uniref:competence/damage-inducible protein A n=1 Tax=Vagococcus carniphilus TaxID=218144 RepID=UPI00288F4969|nr:competence/damage-inducible protein A [Vagococcus carniphilus]MDT2829908.1 competence/damage-inducible protein A [Vagococcus carniphilus]MDT2838342.1 competence/damage-inducible protein A [Vagococcus carniphilus]MDT2854338.1 competence/damage-inducible protein A [Vagococcus carniphilus]
MKAEIIAVGTEILLGQIVNTNAAYLSQYLTNLGFDIYHQEVVGDNEERLLKVLDEASQRSDLVVVCGGLGPTEDDLTKQTVAKYVGKSLVYDEEALAHVIDFFKYSKKPMAENNKQQALTIEGAKTIQNNAGLACGLLYKEERTHYLLLPGPPSEMKAMAENGVTSLLKEILPNRTKLVSRYLRFIGIGESRLVTDLKELIDNQTNPTIAPYAKSNEVMLRITAKCESEEQGSQMLDVMEKEIKQLVGEYFYGYGENLTMEEVVVSLLKEKQQTLTVVEGLTGGLCQNRLTDIPGSSSVYPGGFITYSTKSKADLLGISVEELESKGVYNQQTVEQLAIQGSDQMETDYALAIIGIAGPTNEEDQPVGTLYLALKTPTKVLSETMIINRERDYIRDGAVKHAFNLLRKHLE